MKPHTLSLLKCVDCIFTIPLDIKINKSKKLNYTNDDILLIKDVDINILELFNKENINKFNSSDLYIFKGDIKDITNVYETMLCNYIEEGELICTGCFRKYEIENGIINFLEKVK